MGDKTNGKLEVVGGSVITLSSVKVVKAESNTCYITFEGDTKKRMDLFHRVTPASQPPYTSSYTHKAAKNPTSARRSCACN